MEDEETPDQLLVMPDIIYFEQLCIKMDLPDNGVVLSMILIERALRYYDKNKHIDVQNRLVSEINLKNLATVALLVTQKF